MPRTRPRSSFCAIVDGTAWVSLANRNSDTAKELHFEAAGHIEYEGNFKAAMGY
jgi:hypothetical protein